MFVLKALRQLVWRLLLRQKEMLQTERHAQCQCFLKFLAHINMFQEYYLGNKKPTFLTCNPKHVYAAILESSKNNDLFQNRQIYFHRILEISRNFLDMVSERPAIVTRNQIVENGAVNQKTPALPKKKAVKLRGREKQWTRKSENVQLGKKRHRYSEGREKYKLAGTEKQRRTWRNRKRHRGTDEQISIRKERIDTGISRRKQLSSLSS